MLTRDEIDNLDLTSLADELAQIRETRTDLGFKADNAITKTSLERRIIEVVCQRNATDRSTVICDHAISIESRGRSIESELSEIRSGGLVILANASLCDGDPCLVKIRTENNYPLNVKCVVRSLEGVKRGVAVAFEDLDRAAHRRVERLILELLKFQQIG